jgi:hypothetical protein
MVRYCNKALSMILLLYNLFYMFYTYGLHPNFVVTKYGHDTISVIWSRGSGHHALVRRWRWARPMASRGLSLRASVRAATMCQLTLRRVSHLTLPSCWPNHVEPLCCA